MQTDMCLNRWMNMTKDMAESTKQDNSMTRFTDNSKLKSKLCVKIFVSSLYVNVNYFHNTTK